MFVHCIQYTTLVSSFCAQTMVSSNRSRLYPQGVPVVPTNNVANDGVMVVGSSCSGLFYNKNNRHDCSFRYRQAKRSSTKLHMGTRWAENEFYCLERVKFDKPMSTQVGKCSSDQTVNVPGIKLIELEKIIYTVTDLTSNDAKRVH